MIGGKMKKNELLGYLLLTVGFMMLIDFFMGLHQIYGINLFAKLYLQLIISIPLSLGIYFLRQK